jgi:hypothetical protein
MDRGRGVLVLFVSAWIDLLLNIAFHWRRERGLFLRL